MIIDKELLWLGPYLDICKDVFDLNLINTVKVLPVTEKKKQDTHAKIEKIFKKPGYDILITTHYQQWKIPTKKGFGKIHSIIPISKIDSLIYLAHEMAHLITDVQDNCFDHTPKHKTLESYLLIMFMEKLTTDGYISEEAEELEIA